MIRDSGTCLVHRGRFNFPVPVGRVEAGGSTASGNFGPGSDVVIHAHLPSPAAPLAPDKFSSKLLRVRSTRRKRGMDLQASISSDSCFLDGV